MGRVLAALAVLVALGAPAIADGGRLTDAQVKKILIQESIDAYPGNCPCPYNLMRNGARCEGRSAYRRRGGYAPLCFPSDVTPDMVREYRERNQ